jgi:sphingosine kinase
LRFGLYALKLLAEMTSYKGKITYKLPSQDDWITVEDDFISIYCVSQPWVTSDFFIASKAKPDDSLLWLFLIRKTITRLQMLKLQLGLGYARHELMDCVEFFPVTAFKLEPKSEGSYIVVDGEVIDYGPLEAQIVPKAINILTK